MRQRNALALALPAILLGACAQSTPDAPEEAEVEWTTPAVDEVGRVAEVPEAASVRERPGLRRVVVEITSTPVNPSEANPGLVEVARLLNAYASRGIDPSRLDVVAVLRNDACTAALEPEAYQGLHEVVVDPNGDILGKLTKLGVEVLVDGQSLAERKLDAKTVRTEVTVTPSAKLALVEHQLDGYALLRE